MAKKLMSWKTKGMNRDLSVSAFNPEFSFENINLRLSTNDGNTLMSWVNEKGTQQIEVYQEDSDEKLSINGTVIGTAVLNHQLVLFTKFTNVDFIYRLKYRDDEKTQMEGKVLYSGDLGFDTDYPIETLVSYESESIQKIYWTDHRNQPRIINIATDVSGKPNTYFDFVPTLQLRETVRIYKELGASGMFAPGVIQYSFTYYNKNGQESNIFYTSPLQYISYKERGASPEDKVENAFRISIQNPDTNFDFLRIYSIQRTSINGTPVCKRIQDISLTGVSSSATISFVDTGTTGNNVDPTELLYKGGDIISCETLEQKDNTLFMGNISLKRPSIVSLKSQIAMNTPSCATRSFTPTFVSSGYYTYYNQLTSKGSGRHYGMTVPCGGFKTGDVYRLGVQFQHKSGKWSDPVFIGDIMQTSLFSGNADNISVPIFTSSLKSGREALAGAGYVRMRAVVVFPGMIDRNVICQGVVAPTVYTTNNRNDNSCYCQSSWFFRPMASDDSEGVSTTVMSPKSSGNLRYTSMQISSSFPKTKAVFNPKFIRQVEIQGEYDDENQFKIDRNYRTMHSPDIEFDDQVSLVDFTGKTYKQRGYVRFDYTMSDIDIQTETPTVSNSGAGFVHKPFSSTGAKGIVSGLFYDDFLVDDNLGDDRNLAAYPNQRQSCKFLVYPWQGNGSLNNDMNRPANKGIQTAKLKKKVLSNLRYATTVYNSYSSGSGNSFNIPPQIFSSDEVSILKFGNNLYKGNIDTMLNPDYADGNYFCFNGMSVIDWMFGENWIFTDEKTPFDSKAWCKTFNRDPNERNQNGLRKWNGTDEWRWGGDHIGDDYIDIDIKKVPVRMKYKSTAHMFANFSVSEQNGQLAVVDILQTPTNRFGGTSEDALRENIWLPCGEPVALGGTLYWDYGDTYYQRYDCLKTYPFTREDVNQVVEIGSFMLETRVNIDGRYDRNRGQANNLNMSPTNFNLMNMVYSQQDNFFTYRIMPDSYYKDTEFPNQVTWSKNKENGADVDLWTNVTLASILELDGDKGEITALKRYNDQLLCFQDSGIARILANEMQLQTTDGVPLEIANSGKVQGKIYFSNTVGCSNKWSIVQTPVGIYFMDSNDKSIYLFNGGLANLSQQGFNAWSKKHIPSQEMKWTPLGFNNFISYYDKMNQDILFINNETALAWSERLSTFTSFYDYGNAPFFCNLDDTGVWIKADGKLWKHQAGKYCQFFGVNKPYSITLVGNPEPQADKMFTNIEFRANVEGDGVSTESSGLDTFDESFDYTFHPEQGSVHGFRFFLPFDSLEVWNEYQHGISSLSQKDGRGPLQHDLSDRTAHLARKFRMWRCDIPRNNYPLPTTEEEWKKERELGISRKIRKPMDRMRNSWLYLKLKKEAEGSGSLPKAEIHDMVMTYFD